MQSLSTLQLQPRSLCAPKHTSLIIQLLIPCTFTEPHFTIAISKYYLETIIANEKRIMKECKWKGESKEGSGVPAGAGELWSRRSWAVQQQRTWRRPAERPRRAIDRQAVGCASLSDRTAPDPKTPLLRARISPINGHSITITFFCFRLIFVRIEKFLARALCFKKLRIYFWFLKRLGIHNTFWRIG